MDIIDNFPPIGQEIDKLTLLSLLAEELDTYDILINYKINEDTLLECLEYLDKEVLIQGYDFSENFINKAICDSYFTIDDIKDFTMSTYINLSDEFILKYKNNINWHRMISYISTQSDSFDQYVNILDENNLWYIISANDLPIDFIRKWKDKLDWKFLSMVKEFSDDEKEEFSDYIILPEHNNLLIQDNLINKINDSELEELIEKIQKN